VMVTVNHSLTGTGDTPTLTRATPSAKSEPVLCGPRCVLANRAP
jgi:hypothetical protein